MFKKNKKTNEWLDINNEKSQFKANTLKFDEFDIINLDEKPEKKDSKAVILYDTNENKLVIKRKKIRNYFLAIIFSSLLVILIVIMLVILFVRIS